jgi:signal transduction histidine kinase
MERRGLKLASDLASAPTSGDPHLLERLLANLLDNAVQHNVPGGWVRVSCGCEGGSAFICVSNSGPVVPADELERLFGPFQRLGTARSARADGHGLGLSIVAAIATAHGASVSTRALGDGGLEVGVSFAPDHSLSAQTPGVSLGDDHAGSGGPEGTPAAPDSVGSTIAS